MPLNMVIGSGHISWLSHIAIWLSDRIRFRSIVSAVVRLQFGYVRNALAPIECTINRWVGPPRKLFRLLPNLHIWQKKRITIKIIKGGSGAYGLARTINYKQNLKAAKRGGLIRGPDTSPRARTAKTVPNSPSRTQNNGQ